MNFVTSIPCPDSDEDRGTLASSPSPQEAPVNFFYAVSFEVEELVIGLNVITRKMRDLRGAFDSKQPVSLALAANDIATISGQVSILAKHLCGVTNQYVERNKEK